MQLFLFWQAIAEFGFSLLFFGLMALSAALVKRLRDVPPPNLQAWPSVSLVAAARNEERGMERAVRSLVQLDYPNLEITVVNDRSTDGTGEILARLSQEFPQLNVVHVNELPPGWLGKNHALQIGADRSRGEWLLFTDADIVFEPTTLQRAIGYANAHQVDHLAATPDTQMPTWFLRSFVVTFAIFFSIFVRIWAIRGSDKRAHVGIGAFNLIRAEIYRAVGGHHPIRMRPDDDLKLGKIIKHGGYRQDVVHGQGLIFVDWYHSLGELIRGLEKNAFAGVDYSVTMIVFSSLVLLFVFVWPYAAVLLVPAPARWIYLATCIVLWAMAWRSAVGMGTPASCALAFPVTVVLFIYIQWRTMILNYYHNGIRWRDTHYSLAELKANRV
jgi:cellulose synthase/poly-beta-1,6-N-acetylglucosamine synthase-like glycosyltransferase